MLRSSRCLWETLSVSAAGALITTSALIAIGADPALAGGFALREQSADFQGMSYAGNAAGGALSSMFWNPAATAAFPGLNTESSYSLIIPEAKVTVKNVQPVNPFPGFPNSSEITDVAASGGSYASYQLIGYDPNLFVGIAVNGPFGLLTEPHTENYLGSVLGRTTRLFTLNANPTVAYRVAPGLIIGAGAQIQYADAALKFATGSPRGPNTFLEPDARDQHRPRLPLSDHHHPRREFRRSRYPGADLK